MDYSYATCCSLNNEVAHAFPRHKVLKDSDLIKVDMVLGKASSNIDVSKLDFNNVEVMKKYTESFRGAIADSCWAYAVGEVSNQVVRDLVGHGVGPTMHENPDVPAYGIKGRGARLREGMVLTIEPMVNTGTYKLKEDRKTGWGFSTLDGGLSCQYEHQFVITKDGPVILTSQGQEGTY